MGRFRRSKSPRAAVLAPVLESKLTAPGVRPGHVARQRLVSRLSGFVPQKLTVLAAPAGFGKTTLLAEWFENEPRGSVAWVTLDEHDDDPLRFWSHVVEALRRIAPDVNAALRKGALGETLDSDELVPRLLNVLARVQRPISLVLDDYHVIASERIHESLSQLVHHIPPHVCVVVATRRDPPLPLGRLRAAGDLGELRASDLRFDLAEARALLTESLGLELGDEDVEYLHVKAEGWPAA
ncbi:MAG TPA: AAA family ATPase, partial [Gaiellaceae bacterium]|nr:AAA family ATPase [Gaiellaceae bacterium]